MAIRYGYPKGRCSTCHAATDPATGLALASTLQVRPGVIDVHPMPSGNTDWIASHDAALIEQARAEGKAEADAAWAAKVEQACEDAIYADFGEADEERVEPGVTVDNLRALIPADAQAALDQVRAQAKAEADDVACECPTDDYCPRCHPHWYAKWRAEQEAEAATIEDTPEVEKLRAERERLTAALADLITRHEAHDGRVPCCQLRTVLGMPARDRGEG